MRVDVALLCDSVTVRDQLLHILGGGVTRMRRPEFPSPLGVDVALRIMVHPTEADVDHEIETRLLDEDGGTVETFPATFNVGAGDEVRPGEEISAAFALKVGNYSLPSAGAYSFEILIDGVHQRSLPFVAEVPQ